MMHHYDATLKNNLTVYIGIKMKKIMLATALLSTLAITGCDEFNKEPVVVEDTKPTETPVVNTDVVVEDKTETKETEVAVVPEKTEEASTLEEPVVEKSTEVTTETVTETK